MSHLSPSTHLCLHQDSGSRHLRESDLFDPVLLPVLAFRQWSQGLKLEFTEEDNVAFNEWLTRHGGSIHERGDRLDGEVSAALQPDE